MSNQMSLNPWQQQGAMSYYPPPPLQPQLHHHGALSIYQMGGYSIHPQHHSVGSFYGYQPMQSVTTPPLHPVQAQIQFPMNQLINEYPPPPPQIQNINTQFISLPPPIEPGYLHNASVDWFNQMELLPKPTWEESDDSFSLTGSRYAGSSSEFDEEEDLNNDISNSMPAKNTNIINENIFVHSYIQ
eukprot:814311_1